MFFRERGVIFKWGEGIGFDWGRRGGGVVQKKIRMGLPPSHTGNLEIKYNVKTKVTFSISLILLVAINVSTESSDLLLIDV